jgi:hypothetical protein
MFTETLESKLDDYVIEDNVASGEKTLTASNKTEDYEATVSLNVKEDEEGTVTASITHPDGAWTGTFHTCEDSHEELAQVIADEYQYWLEA